MPISKARLVESLSELVQFRTTKDRPDQIAAILDYAQTELAPFEFNHYKRYEKNGVISDVYATHGGTTFDTILYVHLDVVPGKENQFQLTQDEQNSYARGISDMKSAFAIYTEALRELGNEQLHRMSLAVVLVTDEEVGGFNGAGHLTKDIGLSAKLVFMPDGGDNWRIVESAKGAHWLQLTTKGKSAHASTLWNGENALLKMVDVVNFITESYPVPNEQTPQTTVNIATFSAGTAGNQVPDRAEVVIDVRDVADQPISELITALRSSFPDLEIKTLVSKSAFKVDREDPYIQAWLELLTTEIGVDPENVWHAENGSADHHYFAELGATVLVSKPESGGEHQDEEWANLDSLVSFAELLATYLRLLATK